MTTPKAKLQFKKDLIQGIFKGKLASVSRELLALPESEIDSIEREFIQNGLETCQSIGEYCLVQKQTMIQQLQQAGARVKNGDLEQESRPMQFHSFDLEIEPAGFDIALKVFEQQGFLHWSPKTGGAWAAFRRLNHAMDFIKVDEVTTRMVCRWADPLPITTLSRIFRPSTIDMQWVNLPTALWPLYYALRPARIAVDLFKGRRWPVLGPFLGTPLELIEPLLTFADVTENDVVFDLGCGDGRIVLEAARLRNCRGVGIEQNQELIEIGRQRTTAAGLDDLVKFVHGDASAAQLSDATVVFLFLPTSAVQELLPSILHQLKPGARVVAHEQRPIEVDIQPNRTRPIITHSAVTVAHIWEID